MLYAHERFLLRLSETPYKENFILKGGLLLYALNDFTGRPTRDIDFLAQKTNLDEERIKRIIIEICTPTLNDLLQLDEKSIRTESITKQEEYDGFRVKFVFLLEKTRMPLQIDIGTGDVVTPKPLLMTYPTFFDQDFQIYAYTIETVLAEKFEAILSLYPFNSRYKDYFDIYSIIQKEKLDKATVKKAIQTTCRNRETGFENYNQIFCNEFAADEGRVKLWKNFIKESELPELSFEEVIIALKMYLDPIVERLGG
jgi:predicted nucleotidyltransferase component of viral defense system